ncbi:MBL fold metallo-hydrolase [Chelativorans sp. AA-79]|uniref:MBL fold metallo-hydrolase n=1 Tax=Chelativorans sp. AA-79 TaxID=3028735 RepID=UPI0023F89980|nr:MBL fold metallo-hydrolase [Chelativorans sp. AA-79]WEX09976.1 MBL fold metallo-hydrolase [Chelativorans sp. AA-79]
MPAFRLIASFLALMLMPIAAAPAQEQRPSTCMAIAETLPHVQFASFRLAAAEGEVSITYAGHSTYIIETPAGVTIATDYSGVYGANFTPRVVTMNRAHSSHYTLSPDPAIEYVLTGWNPDGGPVKHSLMVDDVYIRNVTTDIRGGEMGKDGNSIFIFEVAGLCIGHLGHLHHELDDSHYAAIGRLDVVMVPIDGGLTLSIESMSEIARRLSSSIILPMHRFSTPISAFASRMGENFDVQFHEGRTLLVSLGSFPQRPTIIVLEGV